VHQRECFDAGVKFARTEGIIPAPESTHAIAQVIKEANQAKLDGKQKTILFNLSGHGLVDMASYDKYFANELQDYSITEEQIKNSVKELEILPVI
jgi:tryptophan synthase beta chain